MLEPRYRWRFPADPAPDGDLVAAGAALGLGPRILGLLAARGVADPGALATFFDEPRAALHDPALLPDADVFRDRIRRAAASGERVLVFGDFDADGLTGLAIMTRALRALAIDVEPYVPSRLDEGHGLSLRAIETAAASGRTLIVTVDCGTSSAPEIAAAAERGIDVLVTDHHRVPPVLPPALAVVNCHRDDASYPDRRLAGSGIAFKLAQLLLADLPNGDLLALELADLAVIGAVADVTPILGENRAIARLGLERLRTAPRPGIAALLAAAGVAPAAVDLETIGFVIAPRINAAGRVGEAIDAARLLLADDPAEAERIAAVLEATNLARRELSKEALAQARLALVDAEIAAGDGAGAGGTPAGATAVIVRGPWPVGIVGLVAARLAEETGLPAVVGAELDGVVRASCRSGGAVDLAATLEGCSDLLIRHGGHRGAAGFEVATERWDEFRSRFASIAALTVPTDPRPILAIDLALPARAVDYALHREFGRLAPTGPGNEAPLVAVLGMSVVRARAARGGHAQLTLKRELDVLDAIAFGREDLVGLVAPGDRVDVVARLGSRTFGGYETLQLEIRDIAPSAHHPEAAAILGATSVGGPVGEPPVAIGGL